MIKFITGVAVGGLLTTGAYFMLAPIAQTSYADEPSLDTADLKPELSGFWSGVHTNLKLAKKYEGGGSWIPKFSDDTPILSLTTSDPLQQLTRSDIKSVCISTFGNNQDPNWQEGFSVEIYLMPNARRLIGEKLLNRDDLQHSIRVKGIEINSFVADAKKAKYFIENAAKYPSAENLKGDDPNFERSLTDTEADISFGVQKTSVYSGLNLVRILSGSNPLHHCNPELDLNNLPGFTEHTIYWTNLMKQQ